MGTQIVKSSLKSWGCHLFKCVLAFVFAPQLGEDEWRRLSEKERQRLLMEMKLKERRLRREGRLDELNALLGNS